MATLKVPAPLTRPAGTTLSYVDGTGQVRIIAFDATLRDQHEGAADVSFHPLDTNALVTDHVRASPRALTLDVEVTNTPLVPFDDPNKSTSQLEGDESSRLFTSFASVSGGKGAWVPLVGTIKSNVSFSPASVDKTSTPFKVRTYQYATTFDRVKDVWEALDTLRDQGIAVQVVTRLHTYEEMVISRLSAPHGIEDAIVFGIDLVEIRRAESTTIQVDPPVSERRAEKPKVAGNQPTYEPTPSQESVAYNLRQARREAGVLF